MCGDVTNGIGYKVAERLGGNLRLSNNKIQISYRYKDYYELILHSSLTSSTIEVEFGLSYDVVSDEDLRKREILLEELKNIRNLSKNALYADSFGYLPQKPNIWMSECVFKDKPDEAVEIIVNNAVLFADICNGIIDDIETKAA